VTDKKIVRGSTMFVDVVFTDKEEQPIDPATAKLRIAYAVNGERRVNEVELVSGTNHTWSASWDTSPADAGPVFWFAHANGSPTAATEGRVIIEANPANPQGA